MRANTGLCYKHDLVSTSIGLQEPGQIVLVESFSAAFLRRKNEICWTASQVHDNI